MKREFRHENFEEFLKRNADNLRMKAPDRVWQKLSGELNNGKRRFGIGLSAFFLVASILSFFTISNNTRSIRVTEQPVATQTTSPTELSTTKNRTGVTRTSSVPMTVLSGQIAQQGTSSAGSNALSSSEMSVAKQSAKSSGSPAGEEFIPTVVDEHPETSEKAPATSPSQRQSVFLLTAASTTSPWTIESVVNAKLKRRWKESRWQTQYHFAPTISYRKLSENKSYLRNTPQALTQPNYNTLYNNVNNMVTHKPALGFEVGLTKKYALSQTVRVRAGLQFNVNRYDIKAFHAPLALATIALNNRRTARVDSLWTLANYSNVDVTRSNKGSWLQNYSFQVSAPVGVELDLMGSEKVKFGIATSIQPTYVLGDRAYMITSDYKSYTQVPWLLRRWNVNTAFETFVSYQSGKTRWQVGPQVRYQLLSSFISNYPVKENLFDFGLKIGVSVNR